MLPKITIEEVAHLTESLTKGEPNREQIALNIAKEKVRELI